MLTIAPPSSWSCMTRLTAWLTNSGAMRLSVMMAVENAGAAVAASATGEPPALFTAMSRRP